MIQKFAILLLAGLLSSGIAQACTCSGTTSFAELAKHADLVIEGRVTRVAVNLNALEGVVEPGRQVVYWGESVALEVTHAFKGKAPTQIYVADPMMCYKSITPGEMQEGASYIIALFDDVPRPEKITAPIFRIGTCAETALCWQQIDLSGFVAHELSALTDVGK
ncbi:MAG: hypothetical protein LBE62_13465 [Azonexus sp.]|jgi:hypothetical protein|nr:hypothetical protein [Azonexus sp.]